MPRGGKVPDQLCWQFDIDRDQLWIYLPHVARNAGCQVQHRIHLSAATGNGVG